MKWPVGKYLQLPFVSRQLKGEVLVPLEAALERNCAGEAEERGGTSKRTGKEPVSAGSV
jgi:hypothetical protein